MSGNEPPRGRRNLERPAIVLLVMVGAWVVVAPPFLGWGTIYRRGLDGVFLRVLCGFLFLFYAGALLERSRLRRRVDDLYEAVNMLLYGTNYRADREAVRILIRSLSSENGKVRQDAWEHLKRLTGQDFALDPQVWESWWSVHEKRFARKSKRPEE
jgi:hypothetical protein